ncbi:MAG: hypothetical protein H6678_12835 [Candidatus Delongbacteria bacterium]|nr:hypothetical protein [Candidatus Delongbacteria bacterium]
MTLSKPVLGAIAGLLLWAGPFASAESATQSTWSLETDPSTFAFGGHALHVRWSPAALPDWTLGVGHYAMNFPELFVELLPDNRNKGWNQRLEQGLGVFAERTLRPGGRTVLGLQLAVQHYELDRDGLAGSVDYSTILAMPYAGVRWRPTGGPLYIMPWAGLGLSAKLSGDTMLGGEDFTPAAIIPFATMHLGYSF